MTAVYESTVVPGIFVWYHRREGQQETLRTTSLLHKFVPHKHALAGILLCDSEQSIDTYIRIMHFMFVDGLPSSTGGDKPLRNLP